MELLAPHLQKILEETFRLKHPRPVQKTIIEHLCASHDLIALLPTGAGKSLCYQLPALVFPYMTIVVSPLQSLMHDQVLSLQKKGVVAHYLDSTLSEEEKKEVVVKIKKNEIKILYLSPEKLLSPQTTSLLLEQKISHICIDEAHCVFSWGDAFRPEYSQIGTFIDLYCQNQTRPVVSAFTATATSSTLRSLRAVLRLEKAELVCLPFTRPNLEYLVLQPPSEAQKRQALLRILQYWRENGEGSALVYAATRKEVEFLTAWAQSYDFPEAEAFHAGLTTRRKEQTLRKFLQRRRSLLFCTSAFGMGVDKANIRFVIHHTCPTSLESYSQEVGRAGRDGLPASCILFYRASELERNIRFQEVKLQPKEREVVRKKALQMERFALSDRCCGKILFETFLHPVSAQINLACSCYRCKPVAWWKEIQASSKPLTPSRHPQFMELKLQRKLRAEQLKVPTYFLGTDGVLQKIVEEKPQTWSELKSLAGLGHARLFYWGKDILRITKRLAES